MRQPSDATKNSKAICATLGVQYYTLMSGICNPQILSQIFRLKVQENFEGRGLSYNNFSTINLRVFLTHFDQR